MSEVWYEWFPLGMIASLRESSSHKNMLEKEKFLNSIEILNLSGIHLGRIPEIIKEMSNLKALNLSDNSIDIDIDCSVFPDNLTVLDLSKNKIRSFSFEKGTGEFLSKIQEIFLNKNKLIEFPKNAGKAKNLTTLSLSFNNISTLKGIQIPRNCTLNLRNNEIIKIENVSQLKKCFELDLSYNKFQEIPVNLFEGNCKYISLKGNTLNHKDFLRIAVDRGIEVEI